MTKAIEEGVKIGERKMLAQVIKDVDEMDIIKLTNSKIELEAIERYEIGLKQKLASYQKELEK